MQSIQEKDLKYIWHPCSQMKDYEDFPPIIIDRGEGIYLHDIQGKTYIDAVSSWWVNLFGHSNKRINRAIHDQIDKLEHVIFANFSHIPAIELAERIVDKTPESLKKVFFADNGSAAVEAALKLSFQYHQQTGSGSKTKFVALTDAYHGETMGALSVGDMDLYTKIYKPMLMDTFRIASPDCYRCAYNKNREICDAECFEHMVKLIEDKHKEICGVIIEPMVQGAAGMKIYSPIYLTKLKKLCEHYNIHTIADEIAVGFGRTGKMFACEHGEISPDIMCLSKGITGGYMPLSLVVVTDEIYDAFYADYSKHKAFMHSHSYSGNAMACAIACEVLNIFEQDNIIQNNIVKSKYLYEIVSNYIYKHPNIGEYRQLGMIGAIELVENQKSKKAFASTQRVGYNIYKIALEKGVLLRPLGNIIYFMPPYIIEKEEIEKMVRLAFESINQYLK